MSSDFSFSVRELIIIGRFTASSGLLIIIALKISH